MLGFGIGRGGSRERQERKQTSVGVRRSLSPEISDRYNTRHVLPRNLPISRFRAALKRLASTVASNRSNNGAGKFRIVEERGHIGDTIGVSCCFKNAIQTPPIMKTASILDWQGNAGVQNSLPNLWSCALP